MFVGDEMQPCGKKGCDKCWDNDLDLTIVFTEISSIMDLLTSNMALTPSIGRPVEISPQMQMY